MIEMIVGLVLGSVITWLVTWIYYKRSGAELRSETARLRRLMEILVSGLEEGKVAEFRRDEDGNIVGNIRKVNLGGTLRTSGNLRTQVIRAHDESD